MNFTFKLWGSVIGKEHNFIPVRELLTDIWERCSSCVACQRPASEVHKPTRGRNQKWNCCSPSCTAQSAMKKGCSTQSTYLSLICHCKYCRYYGWWQKGVGLKPLSFSRWLWKKQLLLYSHRYIIKALMGQQTLTALCHDVGCGQPLPAPANEPAVQADRRAEHLPQPHSFFSPNPWPKALAQSPLSFFPVPSPHWPQPAPGTGLVSFSSPFLYNVCIFFSAPCASLLLSVPCRGVFPTASLPSSSIPYFCAPWKWHSLHLGCFAPSPSALPSFCWVFPLIPPPDLPQWSLVPPLPPCICICFRETSCFLEAVLGSREPKEKWRFGYPSTISRWKEASQPDLWWLLYCLHHGHFP